MQPTHSASLRAADETPDALLSLHGFDAEQERIDGDASFREQGRRRAFLPHPSLTQSRIEELIRADRRKNEFMAMLSHELRSPLGSIQNAIGVLRGRIHADAAGQQRMHALIERQVRHMTLLVADLLDVSRITCGNPQLQCERIDAPRCVAPRNRNDGAGFEAAQSTTFDKMAGIEHLAIGRRRPARAGVREPACQRLEVYGPGRCDCSIGECA